MKKDEAINLLHEYTKSESLLKHAYSVEQAMKSYANKFEEDVEKWGIVGLLPWFDYERYPSAEEHPYKGAENFKRKGLSSGCYRCHNGTCRLHRCWKKNING